ncbi:MAG: CPBP family intramembrane metalloprotease [Bacteroidetes bacterium]|nr:CPBP family intramembrane metalloprotease [Bacteroidota bacterium]
MFSRYLTYYSPAIQFVIFCAIMSMSMIVGSFVVELLNQHFLGVASSSLKELKEISPQLAFRLKILNPVLLLLILLLPAYLFAYLAYPKPATYLGLQSRWVSASFIMAVVLLVVSLPFVATLEMWSTYIPWLKPSNNDSYEVLSKAMLKGDNVSDLLLNTLAICLIPALAEELFFRGCLQQVLLSWLHKFPYTALLIVAVLFSAFHGQLSGFMPRVFLGLALGLVYYFTGNLWISIFMHFLNNFISVFFTFLKERNLIHFDIADNSTVPLWLGLMSLILSAVLIYFLSKKSSFCAYCC